MQDKIKEIMGLVEDYKDVAIGGFSGWEERMVIESKLRELVREYDQAIQDLNFVVGITNTSEKQQEVRLTEQQSMEYAEKHNIALHRGEVLILKGKSAQEWFLLGGTNTSGVE